ncbi:hypothetical protein MMC08_004521 [Hypocenomyce scalaris]|nr:hypothetical protein [Hypocenomyce scalaris]
MSTVFWILSAVIFFCSFKLKITFRWGTRNPSGSNSSDSISSSVHEHFRSGSIFELPRSEPLLPLYEPPRHGSIYEHAAGPVLPPYQPTGAGTDGSDSVIPPLSKVDRWENRVGHSRRQSYAPEGLDGVMGMGKGALVGVAAK